MKLIKWIDRPTILMDEVNHWLDSLSVDTPINFYNKSTSWVPQFEVREIDDSYQIFAELPGMNKKDINIEVIDGSLTISGEKSNFIGFYSYFGYIYSFDYLFGVFSILFSKNINYIFYYLIIYYTIFRLKIFWNF